MAGNRDKTPPHDDELERAALGSLLFDMEVLDAVSQYNLRPADFYSRANQRVFEAVLSLMGQSLRPDIQTVIQELKQHGKLDEAGGAAYVSSLTTVIPTSANIDYYAQTVKNYSLKRELLRVASEIGVSAYDESRESGEILEEVERRIFKLGDSRQTFTARKIGEVLKDTIDQIEQARKTKKLVTGISSGFDRLDEMTSGFQRSDFIIIGARPSVGKTALALNMAANIAFRERIPIAFFSLEMSDIALTQRLISSEAKVEGHKLRSGYLSAGDFNEILRVSGYIYEAPFHILDMPNMKLLALRTQARKLRKQQNVEIIFIDYLGLIGHENAGMQRYEQISDISRSLKALARELEIPVVVLCQLNRDAQWEEPTLANLRDSGSIEQDADLVLFLHRDKGKKGGKKNEEEKQEEKKEGAIGSIPTELIIAKQRNGPVGRIRLQLETKHALFRPLAKEHEPRD
ncbi:MAG: replicative DNA helicase [Treponema sp.]|jgi:replicative DNA helicase|nr:replicative DNA helicase [Treponema sp.]